MRRLSGLPCLAIMLLSVGTARAEDTINYASRIGQDLTIISAEGLDTSEAVIRTEHRRASAKSYCNDYLNDNSKKCIEEELKQPKLREITADCEQGNFTDFFGNSYTFGGENDVPEDSLEAKYSIYPEGQDEALEPNEASGYYTLMGLYKALCPASVTRTDY